jgi:hypothetical protein
VFTPQYLYTNGTVVQHRKPPKRPEAVAIVDSVLPAHVLVSGKYKSTNRTTQAVLDSARAAGVTVNYTVAQPPAAPAVPTSSAPVGTVISMALFTSTRGVRRPSDSEIKHVRKILRDYGINPFGSWRDLKSRLCGGPRHIRNMFSHFLPSAPDRTVSLSNVAHVSSPAKAFRPARSAAKWAASKVASAAGRWSPPASAARPRWPSHAGMNGDRVFTRLAQSAVSPPAHFVGSTVPVVPVHHSHVLRGADTTPWLLWWAVVAPAAMVYIIVGSSMVTYWLGSTSVHMTFDFNPSPWIQAVALWWRTAPPAVA